MIVECLGHSCFKVTLKNGVRVLFDPFDKTVGYPYTQVEADIVVVSHGHFDHSDVSRVKGDYKLVNEEGVYTFGDVTVESIKTWHDCDGGRQRGQNLVSTVQAGDIKLCHMGDIGCIPADDVFEKLKGTDILLIPVGGHYTVDAAGALEICERVSPNIIIPMHFKTAATHLDIAPVDFFLEAAGGEYDVSRTGSCRFEIDRASLKKRTRIVVMEYM